jgi:hypothetical protein
MWISNLSVLILILVVMGLCGEIPLVEPIFLFVEVRFFVVCRVSSQLGDGCESLFWADC